MRQVYQKFSFGKLLFLNLNFWLFICVFRMKISIIKWNVLLSFRVVAGFGFSAIFVKSLCYHIQNVVVKRSKFSQISWKTNAELIFNLVLCKVWICSSLQFFLDFSYSFFFCHFVGCFVYFFYLVKKIKTLIFFNQLHRRYVQQASKYEVLHENVCFLLRDCLLQLIFIMNFISCFWTAFESRNIYFLLRDHLLQLMSITNLIRGK